MVSFCRAVSFGFGAGSSSSAVETAAFLAGGSLATGAAIATRLRAPLVAGAAASSVLRADAGFAGGAGFAVLAVRLLG